MEEISFISVVYKDFILAANKSDDMDFLKFEFVDTLLRAVGIEQEYAFSDQIREKYFHEDQIGNLTAMTPGAIDVSTTFTSFKIIHCTYTCKILNQMMFIAVLTEKNYLCEYRC